MKDLLDGDDDINYNAVREIKTALGGSNDELDAMIDQYLN